MENKELETWLKETKAKNLSLHQLAKHISMIDLTSNDIYCHLEGEKSEDKAQILFNQWQKEAEFSPKRGDKVLVWDIDKENVFERIFLADIKGSSYPIIVVAENSENHFINNKTFASTFFMNMKPLPTEQPKETDFKSKVIELIEKRIDVLSSLIPTNIQFELYATAHKNKESKEELSELLNQIKQLC